MTMESPLAPDENRSKASPPNKAAKTIEHEQFGIVVKSVGKNVVVSRVKKSGTADAAGVKSGDIVKSIGEMPINNPSDIQELDEVLEPGDTVEFELIRKGKAQKMLVAFERDVASPDPINLRLDAIDDGDDDPQPTLAVRPTNESESDVIRLQQIVESQQQVIAKLQERLIQLEKASTRGIDELPRLILE